MFNLKFAALAIAFSAAAISAVPAQAAVARPNASRYYSYTAYPGEVFETFLSGDGTTDLDLIITNQNRRAVCESLSFGDDEYCRIRSVNGGTYTIEVQNLGDDANIFRVAVK